MTRQTVRLLSLSFALIAPAACAADAEQPPAQELLPNPSGKADGNVGVQLDLTNDQRFGQVYFQCDEWFSCDLNLKVQIFDHAGLAGTLGEVWVDWEPARNETISGHGYKMMTPPDPDARGDLLYFQYGSNPPTPAIAEHTDNEDARFWIEFEKSPDIGDLHLFVYASYQ